MILRDRVYQGYEAHCDTVGCSGWDAFHVADERAMEHRLRVNGWRVDQIGRTYCPGCRPGFLERVRRAWGVMWRRLT